ncbi:MAG: hypothetical protein PF904_06770 [Kiritimatiellae bacterium]|nr:hypothetical protein [Kiritimatiellia bacterium]
MKNNSTDFDFWYAVNNTEIVVSPKRHIETFGNTMINYHLVCELMDDTGKVRVREGRMQALRPQIITPSTYANTMLDGFGDEAHKYMEWLKKHEDSVRVLRYGYTLKKEAFSEQVITDTLDAVMERVKEDVSSKQDPFAAVIKGVDEPWDVCLVKLFWKVIESSAGSNIRELQERHMFEMKDGIPLGIREDIEKAFLAAQSNPSMIKPLGKFLQDNAVFDQYQDRFFRLVQGR